MTLLQLSKDLREKMVRVKLLESEEQIIRTWQPMLQELPLHLARMERLVAVQTRLNQGNLIPTGRSLAPHSLDRLRKELQEFRDRIINRQEKVMQKSGWGKIDTALQEAAHKFESSLREIWKVHLETISPRLEDWLPFFQADAFGEKMRRIKALNKELQDSAQKLPENDEIIAHIEIKVKEIHELISNLNFGDIPPEVKKFMGQVTSTGSVSLGELDDKILSWLREKNLLQAFRVTMGGR